MSNLLKNETSPYLLQHSENPVNWYPWSEDAFNKAKSDNKPIFLSIGYSTCHWCHVMAHESFEDKKIASILNKHFVSIKVDREERPDIDSVYMTVCQTFTGSGGWPMSVFMTWDKKPFFAGTYFPPHSQYGMPGFSELLKAITRMWNQNKEEVLNSADEIIWQLKNDKTVFDGNEKGNLAEKAVEMFLHSFDSENGGFGSAPKFPTPHNLMFLILYSKQTGNKVLSEMAEKTLIQMRKGGIFDHIGYGFSRYSTDKYYLVPHFEKMLYDNALLIMAYAAAYSMTGENIYLDTAEKTAEYVLREMTSCDGAFYSAQDADSEGVEGKYYTFSYEEIIDILGKEQGTEFAKSFDITENGNFGGVNIPNLLESNDFSSQHDDAIKKLYGYRKKRFVLNIDDKILLSWNSLMITALSMLFRTTKNERYLDAAQKAQVFIENCMSYDLQLYTSYRHGKNQKKAFLCDYAFYTAALIELYNSTLDNNYLIKAESICCEAVRLFEDSGNGGYFLCRADDSELFINPKETYDGAIPSGNSVMTYNFVRLYQLTEKDEYRKCAEKQIAFMRARTENYPSGNSMFLISKLLFENPPAHITVVLRDSEDLIKMKRAPHFLTNVTIVSENSDYPLINNKTTYYMCRDRVCLPPTNMTEILYSSGETK